MLPSLRRAATLILLIGLGSSACASSGAGESQANGPITAEELRESAATTVLEAVRELRPQWTARLAGAFLDGWQVSVEQLDQESLHSIAEIRLLSAEEATARYGTRRLSSTYLEIVRRR